jgi:hypothetical protein
LRVRPEAARKDAAITDHPLSALLHALARSAPNAVVLIALAEEVDAPTPPVAEALRWFDTVVHVTDGRYEPCAAVRRRLRGLTADDDPAQTIARFAAAELTTRASQRERRTALGGRAARADRSLPRRRG